MVQSAQSLWYINLFFPLAFTTQYKGLFCTRAIENNTKAQNLACPAKSLFGQSHQHGVSHLRDHLTERQIWNTRINIRSKGKTASVVFGLDYSDDLSQTSVWQVELRQLNSEISWNSPDIWYTDTLPQAFPQKSLGLLPGFQNCNLIYAIQFI